jgi:glycosyltransferase involved in cell wall biosynthesis
MRVIHSVGAVFGGSGFGYIAYSISRQLWKRGVLAKVIALASRDVEIDRRLISPIGFFGPVLGKVPSQILRDNIFDRFAALKIGRCDIFHGWSHQALFSLRKARRLGARIYIERASTHILTQERLLSGEYKKFGLRRAAVSSLVIDKCLKEFEEIDFICVPSSFARQSFLENGVAASKVLLVPYGVDLERFQPAQKKDDVFRVLFVGLLGFRKGLQYLLEAWSKLNLKNAQLLLAGPLLPEFKPLFKKYIGNPSIRWLGFVRGIESLYPQCSVFVLPSIEDGFGLVVLEAMASGIPAIVSTNVGAKDAIDEGRDGFVIQAQDADSLADRLKYLYQRQGDTGPMGRLARAKAECYSWEKTVDCLLRHYLTNDFGKKA